MDADRNESNDPAGFGLNDTPDFFHLHLKSRCHIVTTSLNTTTDMRQQFWNGSQNVECGTTTQSAPKLADDNHVCFLKQIGM